MPVNYVIILVILLNMQANEFASLHDKFFYRYTFSK